MTKPEYNVALAKVEQTDLSWKIVANINATKTNGLAACSLGVRAHSHGPG